MEQTEEGSSNHPLKEQRGLSKTAKSLRPKATLGRTDPSHLSRTHSHHPLLPERKKGKLIRDFEEVDISMGNMIGI